MNDFGKKGANSGNGNAAEIVLPATPVSRGVAIGRVSCIYGDNRQFFRSTLPAHRLDREVNRFRSAHAAAIKNLDRVGSYIDAANSAAIFDMHRVILEDSTLGEKIEHVIRTQFVNAEWAVKLVTDEYIAKYRAISDEHFRDRYIDVEDVADQLQTALGGGRKLLNVEKNSIIAAKELRPTTLAELGSDRVNAIITENGGWTSHTFILARELEIPAVTGVRKLLRRVTTGDTVVVDGFEGRVHINPSDDALERYRTTAATRPRRVLTVQAPASKLATLDGREIMVRANFDLPANFHEAKRYGARGIGLYRSEYLFNRSRGFPREAEQVRAYREIAEFAGEDRARIRTFDLSIAQTAQRSSRREPNPALGMRGIRLALSTPKQLRTQIRALLQASFETAIDIVVPMVTGVDEVRSVRSIMIEEAEALQAKGSSIGEPRLGAMIEVPSAVLTIEAILREVDCICLGTNDLVQYTLGVDRDNESVSGWFRSLHPAIVLSIEKVVNAAEKAGKPVVICGEMAGSVFYVPMLIGLGATELSMNVNSMLNVRQIIAGIAYEETRDLVSAAKQKATAHEIEDLIRATIESRWKHLYPPDFGSDHR